MSERLRTRILVLSGANTLVLGLHCFNLPESGRFLDRWPLNEAFASISPSLLFQPFLLPAPAPEWNGAQDRQANRAAQTTLRNRVRSFRSRGIARARRLPRPQRPFSR